jgi:hypothetical protein
MNNHVFAKVIWLGAGIPDGLYNELFGSHRKAVNLAFGRQVISICNRDLCPGPFRIVLDLEDVSEVRQLSIRYGEIVLNDVVCASADAAIYRVPDFRRVLAQAEFDRRLESVFQLFQQRLPAQCIASLLKNEGSSPACFDAALGTLYRKGVQHFAQGDYAGGVSCFKGRGFGLTPGGDDFLSGFMLGLAYQQIRQKKSLSEIMDLLFYESLSENLLSNTFLTQAYRLQPDRDWAEFLLALESQTASLPELMARICAIGATSGYDTLSGFFAAWEML